MKLKNFEIVDWIELRSGNVDWDVHNSGHFEGLELIPAQDAVRMKWTAFNRIRMGRSNTNGFSGMNLFFDGLQFLKIGPRDPEMPFTEDRCVSAIIRVDPNVQHEDPYMRVKNVWAPEDPFRLVFLFQSARQIEIESKTVELIPVA